jgi:hypothetical protein
MSTDAAGNPPQTKQREFMSLLPLTLQIAGLPDAEHGKYFNDAQMELRANSIRTAYKFARQLVLEVSK